MNNFNKINKLLDVAIKLSRLLFIVAILLLGITILSTHKTEIPEEGFSEITIPEPPPPKEPTYEDALNSITKEELKEDLYYLASDELKGRMTGEKGNELAAEYIKKRLEDCGVNVEFQEFTARRRK
jgi:hypothetical protein